MKVSKRLLLITAFAVALLLMIFNSLTVAQYAGNSNLENHIQGSKNIAQPLNFTNFQPFTTSIYQNQMPKTDDESNWEKVEDNNVIVPPPVEAMPEPIQTYPPVPHYPPSPPEPGCGICGPSLRADSLACPMGAQSAQIACKL